MIAEGPTKSGIGRSFVDLTDARKLAINACKEKDCKSVLEVTNPGFFVVLKPTKNAGSYFVQHGHPNLDNAMIDAKSNCEKEK